MERDDIFVGLPFSVKAKYDDFKREIPKVEEYLERISKIHDANKKKLDDVTGMLSKMNNDVKKLFLDISGNVKK